MGSPSGGREPLKERDRSSTGQNGSRRTGGGGGGGVEGGASGRVC